MMPTLFRVVSRDGERGRIDTTRPPLPQATAEATAAKLNAAYEKDGRLHWVIPVIDGLNRAEEALFAALLVSPGGFYVSGQDVSAAKRLVHAEVAKLEDHGKDQPAHQRWWAEAIIKKGRAA